MTEQFTNNAISTLTGAILAGDTTLTVANASLFPASAQFRIMVDTEIMLVTNVVSTTFTITRGAEGTVAAGHSNGATVEHILTAGALAQFKLDAVANTSSGLFANRPAAGIAGRIYNNTDGVFSSIDNGTSWVPFGPVYPLTTPPPIGSFTGFHISDATVVNTNGAIYFQSPNSAGSTQNLQGYEQSKTTGQSVVAAIIPHNYPGSGFVAATGIYVRDSVGGTVSAFNMLQFTDNFFYATVDRYTSPTAYSSSPLKTLIPGGISRPVWLRIRDDGVNFNYEYSFDSQNYWTAYSEARAAWVSGGGNVFGFYNSPFSAKVAQTIISWKIG